MSTGGKLKINDLKYIVMEGGGARGATYLGAIRELEKQLKHRVESQSDEKVASLNGRKIPGIMDFLKITNKNNEPESTKPIIEGVAGASAGAITTFAIVLGLNSNEIKEVLDFPFENFLSEIDAGKYRMIDENSQLAVGEDEKVGKATEHPTLRFNRGKGVGIKHEKFAYTLVQNKTRINGNLGKFAKRELVVDSAFKIIIDGASYNLVQVLRYFSGNKEDNWFGKFINFIFGSPNQGAVSVQTAKAFATRLAYSSGTTALAYGLFNIKSKKIKVNANSIAGVFADRGMFSGFQVREFFLDLMIFAATKDTYFQKQLIEFFNNPDNKKKYVNETKIAYIFKLGLKQEDFNCTKTPPTNFQIGKRSQYSFSKNFKILIEHLEHLTFREFYNIMNGVEYAVSVSNFTTNSPLYFSDKYTPNARVLEAVAASMSIPPAIRPLYNAGDVLLLTRIPDSKSQKIDKENISLVTKKEFVFPYDISVRVNGVPKVFVKLESNMQKFKKSDYEIYEYAFKKAFQKYLEEREKGTKVYIDTNVPIEMNTFLDEMQKLLIGTRLDEQNYTTISEWPENGIEVQVDNNTYVINRNLIAFFYNAQFKGLLIDGGYFNNIPFNYFREKGKPNEIDNVLAIKLDGHFSPDFLNSLDQSIAKFKVKLDEVINQIEREEFMEMFGAKKKEFNDYDKTKIDLQPIYDAIALMFYQHNRGYEVKLHKDSIRKIVKEWYKYYGQHNNLKPWEIPRPILDTAFTGYSYGSERGQIRNISDHNHIIPLYDYGVGTYDFDLEEVRPLVKLAQYKAEIAVKEYFEGNKNLEK